MNCVVTQKAQLIKRANKVDQEVTIMANRVKRSSSPGMTRDNALTTGVGGRRGSAPDPRGGGGYLNICNITGEPLRGAGGDSPRISELREMGLGQLWIDLAEAVGIETFILVWSHLDKENLISSKRARIPCRILVPHFHSFLRYQRNKYICHLADSGMSPADIKKEISDRLGENISQRHLRRIISRRSKSLRQDKRPLFGSEQGVLGEPNNLTGNRSG